MNHARAGELPLIRLDKIHWFRSVEERYQFEPPLVHTNRTRFNRGDLQVIYFAPDQVLARFEARDVLGHWFGDAVPSPRNRHVVVEYRIDLGSVAMIVDSRPPELVTVDTTVQEMTGDWHSYPWGVTDAPTQNLASAIYARLDAPLGLTAPSARNPQQNNLILFADRLPPRSISFERLLLWHDGLLSDPARIATGATFVPSVIAP